MGSILRKVGEAHAFHEVVLEINKKKFYHNFYLLSNYKNIYYKDMERFLRKGRNNNNNNNNIAFNYIRRLFADRT